MFSPLWCKEFYNYLLTYISLSLSLFLLSLHKKHNPPLNEIYDDPFRQKKKKNYKCLNFLLSVILFSAPQEVSQNDDVDFNRKLFLLLLFFCNPLTLTPLLFYVEINYVEYT